MSVQNLIQDALEDGARSTKFLVELIFPCTIDGTDKLSMQVKSSAFPARGHQRMDIKYMGRTIPLRGQVKYNNSWVCSFYLTPDHKLKKIFEDWINGLDPTTHFEKDVYSEGAGKFIKAQQTTGYSVDMIVRQVDFSESKKTCAYKLHNVFPVEVAPVSISYEGPGRVLEYDVTFTYSWWEAIGGEDS